MENDTLKEEQEGVSRVYELGYLLVPTIKEEDVSVNYGNLKELISSFGSEIITDEMPKMINLAYSVRKVISNVRSNFNKAYFGWTKFTMNGEQVLELKKNLNLNPNFIRFLILKTVKENTIAAKRFVRGEIYRKPKLKNIEDETVVPINKEEIDKEIDALVAV
ncbi:30S ribosomal protein S6 [Candidatus Nomurabacteria bacterium]|nr:30S ribosomal protein S6 [Candidatus Nomurabacteria bacterium]